MQLQGKGFHLVSKIHFNFYIHEAKLKWKCWKVVLMFLATGLPYYFFHFTSISTSSFLFMVCIITVLFSSLSASVYPPYTHTLIHIHMYVSVYVCIWKRMLYKSAEWIFISTLDCNFTHSEFVCFPQIFICVVTYVCMYAIPMTLII